MKGITDAIKHLIIINVLFFIATAMFKDQMFHLFSLWFPKNENFGLWQIVSHMFMHGGLMHILFNMYGLYAFGTPLERIWGRNKFFFFFFSAGIGAALIHTGVNYYHVQQGLEAINSWLPDSIYYEMLNVNSIAGNQMYRELFFENAVNLLNSNGIQHKISSSNFETLYKAHESFKTPVVGASGAVYGVLVAFAFLYSEAELMLIFLPIPIKAKYFVPLLLLSDVFFGFSNINTGTAHFAHLGGALIGFIMMWYWKKNQFNDKRWN